MHGEQRSLRVDGALELLGRTLLIPDTWEQDATEVHLQLVLEQVAATVEVFRELRLAGIQVAAHVHIL